MQGPRPRVLVIEDDPATARVIFGGLRRSFEVELSSDGPAGARKALREQPDAVVLDLGLKDGAAFAVLEQVESRVGAPVLVLTGSTGASESLRAFELGAADYLRKPFHLQELELRLRVRMQRRGAAPRRTVSFADVTVDLDAREARRETCPLGLTAHQYQLLAYLCERPGHAVERERLAGEVLGLGEERAARTVDSHVVRIRRKLGERAAPALVTVWGVGYRFDPARAEAA